MQQITPRYQQSVSYLVHFIFYLVCFYICVFVSEFYVCVMLTSCRNKR